jgi:hypothetical protein
MYRRTRADGLRWQTLPRHVGTIVEVVVPRIVRQFTQPVTNPALPPLYTSLPPERGGDKSAY